MSDSDGDTQRRIEPVADDWETISELFGELLDVAPAQRGAMLARIGQRSPAVRQELESLLRAHASAGDFLAEAQLARLDDAVARLAATPPDLGASPYAIERQIGSGGMGAVYLAHRSDGQFEQRVALKLVRSELRSDTLRERFLLERQILARLQHPNVARLLDGGVTRDGQPWYAMEYVEGRPLLEDCDAQGLSVRQRLERFVKVCDAVAYAHRNLVVHRDLKPSNILVDARGEPRLLDFGIAKLLAADPARATADLTGDGLHPVTPDYCAPEQLTGAPITTATDVYALGVMLYELLCGHRPHYVAARAPRETVDLVLTAAPERPSARVTRAATRPNGEIVSPGDVAAARDTTPERLQRTLRGDLDTIVLQAIRKEPARRYAGADALADDLRRFLDGCPVQARGDGLAYRLGKFVRRHAVAAASTAVVCVAVLTGLFVALSQAEVARREAARAAAVSDFLRDMLASANPENGDGDNQAMAQVLEAAVQRLDGGDTPLAGEPLVEASLRQTIGQTWFALGRYAQARSQMERAWELYGAAAGEADPRTLEAASVLAVVLGQLGRFEECERLLSPTLATMRRVLGEDHPATLRAMSRLATLYGETGDYAAAEALARRTVTIRQRSLGPSHPSVFPARLNVAAALAAQGRREEATALLEETLPTMQDVLGEDHRYTRNALANLGHLYTSLGRPEEGLALHERVHGITRQVLGDAHPVTLQGAANVAEALAALGRGEEALALLERTLPGMNAALGAGHPDTIYLAARRGAVLGALGRLDEARAALRRAEAAALEAVGDMHPLTAEIRELAAQLAASPAAAAPGVAVASPGAPRETAPEMEPQAPE